MRPAPPPRPGWLPTVDPARCTGCGWCVGACPPHVLSLQAVQWRKRATLHDAAACTGCSACALRCPVHAIAMRRMPAPGPASTGVRGVHPAAGEAGGAP